MIVLAWSLFVLVSLLVATNQAFLAAPAPVHGVSSYDATDVQRRLETNEVIHKTNNNHEQHPDDSSNDDRDDEPTVYVIEFESELNEKEDSMQNKGKDSSNDGDSQNPLDPWSIVWYIGSFGGLVAFFLIVSCSEWCCRRGGRTITVPYAQRAEVINGGQVVTETPPPPYHLFAPPPYDSVNYGEIVDKTSGEKLDIYVISVPIHRPVVQVPA
ncbi:uncharacterized protein LOC100879597 [Megachile rotundata]|uniref:uncharacterized protein LOC100879597 n=1 Tax=Megachile rotundata TaxID=143995 RepID=UPI000258E4B2|nr:PREDICTED: uncharacterized protein LOC100879597 [Megachile rotundata]XP_012142197.1 PREDICTED: uncharacterized protein LOC100879597 [Megachile rotundata]